MGPAVGAPGRTQAERRRLQTKAAGEGRRPPGARGWWWAGSVVRLLFDALDGDRQRRTRGFVGRGRV